MFEILVSHLVGSYIYKSVYVYVCICIHFSFILSLIDALTITISNTYLHLPTYPPTYLPTYVPTIVPFEIRGFSLPLVVFSIGVGLTGFSFAGYFLNEGGGEGALSSLGFVYGIPVFLIGLSLWYAEIPPVEVVSSPAGDAIWDKLSTEIFQQVKQDVTRHRYGDDAHLDSTLEALGLKLPQKKFPKLLSITQEDEDGELAFTLAFQSLETPYKVWSDPDRVKRYAKFFGPDIAASVYKMDSEKRIVALKLKTNSKGISADAVNEDSTTTTVTEDLASSAVENVNSDA